MSAKFISLNNVKKTYASSSALNGISLELYSESEYVITGASGSGKSTLLYLLGGLDRPTAGTIIVNQKNLSDLSDQELAIYRNRFVGFVFQFHFLLSSMDAHSNMMLPFELSTPYLGTKEQIMSARVEVEKRIAAMADHLGVTKLLYKYPYEMSGGEQQRISIIRALSLKPRLLLCDEPTGNLDSENSKLVVKLIRELAKEFQATLLLVTHDSQVANNFSELYRMKDGLLI